VSRPALAQVLWLGLGVLASPLAARAQDLDAGKTPAQLFSSHCSACHRTPQGLAKQTFGLASFLRQHYTSSPATASALAAYVAAAGPDPRATRDAQRGGRERPPAAPVPDGGDPRIAREPAPAPAASAQPPPEPPKPRLTRDPRLAVAVDRDPQPFLILSDPIPVPPDPTPRRTPPVPPAPSELRPTLPDTTATTPAAAGAAAAGATAQGTDQPATTTAELSGGGAAPPVGDAPGRASADQPTFAAPLP
jgi:hypothetical protein